MDLLKCVTGTICALAVLVAFDPVVSGASAVNGRVANWDKTGTTGGQEKEAGSQAAIVKALASRVSFPAEGTGLEPATGKPAPDFESGC